MNYYNEFDPHAAAWLCELISQRLIPRGLVDDRSITEVKAEDLEGFTQCHFFAGIGGWPLALQLAGVSHKTPLWTGSPPCQPFSVAGKQLGQLDERHLAPTFMRLLDQCRPPVLFGEQVAAAIGKHWLDDLFTELERQGYACGAAVLPAASVGAPHKRDRLFFGAHQLANATGFGREWGRSGETRNEPSTQQRPERLCDVVRSVADAGRHNASGKTETTDNDGSQADRPANKSGGRGASSCSTNPHHSFWSDVDWLGCRDGKFRPVESGTFPLAHGVSARVGRLRGYGNAIVPQVAAEFIAAFMGAAVDAAKG